MNPPVEFLTRLARAITSFSLYRAGHPARESALDEAEETLTTLLASDPEPVFTFLEDDVIYQDRPLSELRNLPLSRHLTRRRIQRIEISAGLTREEFRSFLEETSNQLSRSTESLIADPTRFPHIRFGSLEQGEEGKDQDLPFDLTAEVEKVDFLHEEVAIKGRVSTALARAVVQTLSTAMRYSRNLMVPLLSLKDVDQYSTVHSMNTSMLAMAVGEYFRLPKQQIRIIGEAALLHDMGKVTIPYDILNKPGPLNEKEWEIIRQHPAEGARILLRSPENLELAAIAAYEHHIKWNGEGYPSVHYKRRPHRLAQITHLCDTFDAMRTQRPFSDPIPTEKIFATLVAGAGTEYHPELVRVFINMMGSWSSRITEIDVTDDSTPYPESEYL